jgi:hypothetical protein
VDLSQNAEKDLGDSADRVSRARSFVASIWPDRAYVNRRAHSLWTSIDESDPEFQASCCLFQLGDDTAVITAAHALPSEEGRQFIVGTGGQLFNLYGQGRWATTIPGGRKGEDEVDIQVVLLDRNVSDRIPRTGLVNAADVEFQDEDESGCAFLLSGFPASRQRVIPKDKRTESDLYSLVLSAPTTPREQKRPRHLELVYDQNNLFRGGQRITSVSPRGMSGAGVWRLNRSRLLGDRRRLQLAGIFIERTKGRQPALLATRVAYPLRLILGIDAKFAEFLPSWVKRPI